VGRPFLGKRLRAAARNLKPGNAGATKEGCLLLHNAALVQG
jgi:hypothetical protein